MTPARILACEPQHQLLNLQGKRRPPTPARRLAPLPAHRRPIPTQQRPWSDQTCTARAEWQVTSCRCEQGPISRPKVRPRDLPAQNFELMPQH